MGEQHRRSQAIRRWREAADPDARSAYSKLQKKLQKLAQRRREVAAKKSRSMRARQLIPGEKLRLRMRGLTAGTTKPVEDVQLSLAEQLRAQGHRVVGASRPPTPPTVPGPADATLPKVAGHEWADVDFVLEDDISELNDLARDHNEAEQAKLDAAAERKDAAQRARDARHGITRWPDTVHLLDES
jgi:hypothetical protein